MDDGKHYLEIVVEPYPSPISLRGRYYSRSGSVTTELTGKALDAFLLKRYGKTCDSLPVPSVSVSDLKSDASPSPFANSERLTKARISASVGSVEDTYDLAGTINGLYKTQVIRHEGSWRGFDDVEFAALKWVDWYNKERLFSTIGYATQAELEEKYWEKESARAA